MLRKSKKNDKIIGRKVKLLSDITNKRGVTINKGEIVTIIKSYNGLTLEAKDRRTISRVSKRYVSDNLSEARNESN